MRDLTKLTKPFAEKDVKRAPQGKFGDYVAHSMVTQKLLATVGPFDMEVRDVIREGGDGMVTGVVLCCTFQIDNRDVAIEEVGDVENPEQKKTDGSRMKDAMSDALKRCAMRVGVGLHLWESDDYALYGALEKQDKSGEGVPSVEPSRRHDPPTPSPIPETEVAPADPAPPSSQPPGSAPPSQSLLDDRWRKESEKVPKGQKWK